MARSRTTVAATVAALALLAAGTILFAQTATPRAPGPETRVSFFAGDWTFTGQLDGAAFGPDHPEHRVTEHCEMLGDVFLICRYEIKRATAPVRGLGVFGYDGAARTYFFTSYDNQGAVSPWSARVKGDTWSLVAASGKARTTWKELSPTSYHIMIETLQADDTWTPVMVGTCQK